MTFHGCIDKIEHRLNERLKETLVPNLEAFKAALEKTKDNIKAFQIHQLVILSELIVEKSEEEEPLFDITRKPVDKNEKEKRKISDRNEQTILEKRVKKKEERKKVKAFS